jgi:hypothetical protein
MRPVKVTVGPLVASATTAICLSQTPPAGALTLNGALVVGGVAVLDVARTILFSSTGNNSTSNFTIVGTDWAGNPISEVLAGSNGATATSLLSYKTVTSITSSASSAAGLTVGTGTTASSPWVRFDEYAAPQVSIQTNAFGTVNYTVQQTLDDPNSPTDPVAPAKMTWINAPDTALVSAAGSIQSNYAYAPTWARVVLNSGTGHVDATFTQAGNAAY